MSILVSNDHKLFSSEEQSRSLLVKGASNTLSFDTVRLSGDWEDDSGDFVCEARTGANELNRT